MLKIINPATGDLIEEIKTDNEESVANKYVRARKAQKEWKQVPLEEKIQAVKKFRELIIDRKEKLAAILTSEVGKPITQSFNELNGLLGRLDFFIDNVKEVISEEPVFNEGGMYEKIVHEPLGVIANISAWNYPYFVGSNVFIPALLTGNTVLYKPSEFATLTGLAIANLLYEAGIPQDAFIPVIGGGGIGAAILEQDINGVFFTGSYETGARIARSVAGKMVKIQLELGGKDPAYICEDVDIAAAAASVADGAFYNTGQSCCSVERVYVHEIIYDSFLEAFLENVKGFSQGEPTDSGTYIGALTRRELHIAALENQVNDALEKGATLLTGGKKTEGRGYYFEPTVFSDVNHTMSIMTEETFGPLIGIQKVTSDEEAVSLMNDTSYGLTSGVYTRDKARAEKILAEMNSGTVYWNCCDRISPRLPWSGRGHSGIGSTLSRYGILAFVQPKAWHLKG